MDFYGLWWSMVFDVLFFFLPSDPSQMKWVRPNLSQCFTKSYWDLNGNFQRLKVIDHELQTRHRVQKKSGRHESFTT